MLTYVKPQIEILLFDHIDVLTASGIDLPDYPLDEREIQGFGFSITDEGQFCFYYGFQSKKKQGFFLLFFLDTTKQL